MKSKNNTKRKSVARLGIKIEHNGKQYISLKELCDDLDVPYHPAMHKYTKNKDVEDAINWALKVKKDKERLVCNGKQYNSIMEVSTVFCVNTAAIYKGFAKGKSLDTIISEAMNKEMIIFEGKKYAGITELSTAYNRSPSMVVQRLSQGMTLQEVLLTPIQYDYKPGHQIEFQGVCYQSIIQLLDEKGIAYAHVQTLMNRYDWDIETTVEVVQEMKYRIGIPEDKMISTFPRLMIHNKSYMNLAEFSYEVGLSTAAIRRYKSRHNCEDIIDTLQRMQKEKVMRSISEGVPKTGRELKEMGYRVSEIRRLPKELVPRYPQLSDIDFSQNCVDVERIYEEVKEEKLNQCQGMQMMM